MKAPAILAASLSIAAVVLVAPPSPAAEPAPAGGRPDIIFFLSDDHRADLLGCAGHPILKTPNLDRLAASGARFTEMFVTTSICAASRASIFTGLVERSHRYTFGTPPIARHDTVISYPAILRAEGYRTGFVGKFGVAVEAGETGRMFDSFQVLDRSPYFKPQPDGSRRHVDDTAGDRAIEFLRSVPAGRPLCLSVSFNSPHAEDDDKANHYPWPPSSDGMYDDVEIPPPPLSDPAVFESQPEFLKKSLNRVRWYWQYDTPEKYRKNMRAYYRMISGVDAIVGRVLDEVGRLGRADRTVVIFTGDNGYYTGSRGFAGKWSHYEESLRTPLIIHDPRLPRELRGRTVDAMALNIDIPATILDIAGIPVPASYQGASLRPWLEGSRPAAWRRDFFCEHLMAHEALPRWEGVREEGWIYARYFDQEPPHEFLHDLRSDPQELRNLASDPGHAGDLRRLRARCDELRDRAGGPFDPEPARRYAKDPTGKGR